MCVHMCTHLALPKFIASMSFIPDSHLEPHLIARRVVNKLEFCLEWGPKKQSIVGGWERIILCKELLGDAEDGAVASPLWGENVMRGGRSSPAQEKQSLGAFKVCHWLWLPDLRWTLTGRPEGLSPVCWDILQLHLRGWSLAVQQTREVLHGGNSASWKHSAGMFVIGFLPLGVHFHLLYKGNSRYWAPSISSSGG